MPCSLLGQYKVQRLFSSHIANPAAQLLQINYNRRRAIGTNEYLHKNNK